MYLAPQCPHSSNSRSNFISLNGQSFFSGSAERIIWGGMTMNAFLLILLLVLFQQGLRKVVKNAHKEENAETLQNFLIRAFSVVGNNSKEESSSTSQTDRETHRVRQTKNSEHHGIRRSQSSVLRSRLQRRGWFGKPGLERDFELQRK